MLFLGFSAGLPLLLILGTLSFWLREAGIDRSTIGYLTWVGLIYAFKWMWAPLVDRLSIPLLSTLFGRRRSWLLFAQLLIVLGLVGMASVDPKVQLTPIVWCALLVAFGSATQDIALDAFRIESADSDHQAALAATYQTGYRLALIWAGAGVLWLAARAESGATGYDPTAWQFAYLCMALSIGVGVITTLFSKEPIRIELAKARNAKAWLHQTLIEPFADFIRRYGWHAILILSLIAIYRISDVVMGIMANPFYVDMGYTKDEVAAVTKIYGVVMTPRTNTEIVLVSDWIESNEGTRRLLGVFQSDESGLLGSFPSGLTGMQTNTRSALVYHTADAQWNDVAWLVNRLTFDPALVSAPWMCEVAEVEALVVTEVQHQVVMVAMV